MTASLPSTRNVSHLFSHLKTIGWSQFRFSSACARPSSIARRFSSTAEVFFLELSSDSLSSALVNFEEVLNHTYKYVCNHLGEFWIDTSCHLCHRHSEDKTVIPFNRHFYIFVVGMMAPGSAFDVFEPGVLVHYHWNVVHHWSLIS